MAVTKIHPIKSTLKKALDYITNPAKTDGKLYVSSFGCAVETADIEFEKTRLRGFTIQLSKNFTGENESTSRFIYFKCGRIR